MKTILFLLLLAFSAKSIAQSNSSTVTFDGIGKVKLYMSLSQLEKVIGKPIKLKKVTKNGYTSYDTLKLNFEGIDVAIHFIEYPDENEKTTITIDLIESNNPVLKTKSGIGIGDDPCKILNTYQEYSLASYPEKETKGIPKKNLYSIQLISSVSQSILFYIVNDKIAKMTVLNLQNGD